MGCLVCISCNANSFHFFYIQHLNNDCSYIEVVHLLFCIYFMFFFSILAVLNLDIFFCKMLRGCPVCEICNTNSFHSKIFKLCVMIINTVNMCTSYFVHI